jgi:lipopolysaccharide export system protein LptA
MLIKKLFGSYSRFVKVVKLSLSSLAFLIALYLVILILFSSNKGKIKLSKSNIQENSKPYLTIINSSIDGIYFGKYKYNIITRETEKDNHGNFILYGIDAKIISDERRLNITSDSATYSETEQIATIREKVKIFYLNSISLSEEISANFIQDFFSSKVTFSTTSEDYDFEALNGFKSNNIDFTQINFFGPIRLDLKKKKSTLRSDDMKLLVTKKDKKLISSEFRNNVEFKNEKFNIKSDKADYLEDKKQFIFYDNLTINSENKKLVGDIFIYDMKRDLGFVRSKNQQNKRVEIYFNDKKK